MNKITKQKTKTKRNNKTLTKIIRSEQFQNLIEKSFKQMQNLYP